MSADKPSDSPDVADPINERMDTESVTVSEIYNIDVVTWSEQQVGLLRRLSAGEAVNAQIDWDNIIEEIIEVATSKRERLEGRVSTILQHLIKLQASPAANPRNKWKITILEARRQLAHILGKSHENASLRAELPAIVSDETQPAREDAAAALAIFGETPRVDLASLSYTPEQVTGDWFPPDPP